MHSLSPSSLALVAQLLKGHHIALAVQWFGPNSVSAAALESIVDAGLMTPEEVAAVGDGELAEAYLFGHKLAADPSASVAEDLDLSFDDLNPWHQRMAASARQHGAAMVMGLGNKYANDLTLQVISSDNAQAQAYRKAIADATATAVEQRETWSQLRTRLGEILDEDWTRDLGRIAATEIQRAVNAGYADAVADDAGNAALVAVIPQPDACKNCLRFYLENGRPRIFRLADLPDSSVNRKKKKAEQVPCRPPAHPWCHCQLVYVEPGWAFDENWNLMPPATGD